MSVEAKSDLLAEAYENYRAYLNPPLARVMKLSGSPVEVRAEGCVIVDQTGKEYLDFAGGYGVFTLGHRHPRVLAAVRQQLESLALSGRTMFSPPMGRLAKRLAEITPGDLQISFFANSGAEAARQQSITRERIPNLDFMVTPHKRDKGTIRTQISTKFYRAELYLT